MKGFCGVTENEWSKDGLRLKDHGSGHKEAHS